MINLFTGLNIFSVSALTIVLVLVLLYEAINGFHDTANAIAIVIYTRTMSVYHAVMMAGIFNFLGVLFGGLSVAYTIIHILPIDLLLDVGSTYGLSVVFSILLSCIIWNFGTWYIGLPTSSSHTLIGSIIGINIINSWMNAKSIVDGLNISIIINIFLSLILSPIISLFIASCFIFFLRRYWNNTKKQARIHMTPANRERIDGKKKPPFWTRIAIIISAVGVSYSHGANDGQKGIGLVMLALIGIIPGKFSVNMNASNYEITRTRDAIYHFQQYCLQHTKLIKNNFQMHKNKKKIFSSHTELFHGNIINTDKIIQQAQNLLNNLHNYNQLSENQRSKMRCILLCISDMVDKVIKKPNILLKNKLFLLNLKKDLLKTIEYAPIFVILIIALALSLGTMIGWRNVVITISNKIGKKDMSYAHGISAQITAATSIGIASYSGIPISTTHILSSAVAGAMLADGCGVQISTIKNIIMAWILTFPICAILSAYIYWIFIQIM